MKESQNFKKFINDKELNSRVNNQNNILKNGNNILENSKEYKFVFPVSSPFEEGSNWNLFKNMQDQKFVNLIKRNDCDKAKTINFLIKKNNEGNFKECLNIKDYDESIKNDERDERLLKILRNNSSIFYGKKIEKELNKNNHSVKGIIYHAGIKGLNINDAEETRLFFLKNCDEKTYSLILFDPYHLGIPSKYNGDGWKNIMEKKYELHKNNQYDYLEIIKDK